MVWQKTKKKNLREEGSGDQADVGISAGTAISVGILGKAFGLCDLFFFMH